MEPFFQFESDFVESLRCIPMQVRFKLDTCGVKLKLTQWHQLSQAERQHLVTLACSTPAEIEFYRATLQNWVQNRTGAMAPLLPIEASPAWLNEATIPESVQARASALAIAISPSQWAALTPLQRFALIKLSQSGHENSNFLPAMQEFGLTQKKEP